MVLRDDIDVGLLDGLDLAHVLSDLLTRHVCNLVLDCVELLLEI